MYCIVVRMEIGFYFVGWGGIGEGERGIYTTYFVQSSYSSRLVENLHTSR